MTIQTKLITAVIIVGVIYLFIVILMYSTGTNPNWPPIVAACPDYWTVQGTNENQRCVNTRSLGTCPPTEGNKFTTMNFSEYPYDDALVGTCNKYKWANTCNVPWDGITYGVVNPCDSV
jgi:hypothetical protein